MTSDALQPYAEPVPLDDRGLLVGDGLFETLLWTRGALVLGPEHANCMTRGAAVLGLPAPPPAEFLTCAEAAVGRAALGGERAAVRVTLTAGSGGRGLDRPPRIRPRLFAVAAPSPAPAVPARLALASVRRNAGSPASRLKTLAYLDNVLAREEARADGADEAVMLNTEGVLACAAAANLFWVRDGALLTPPTDAGCLDGLMRGAVLAAADALGVPVRTTREPVEALGGADAIFLTSSLIGVREAILVGAPPRRHPLVARLQAVVAHLT